MTDEQPTMAEVMAAMEAAASGSAGGQASSSGGSAGGGNPATSGSMPGGQGPAGSPPPGGRQGTGSGSGPLTPAEQVAILDSELERGTGEFDAMILEEQAQQRRDTRAREPSAMEAPEPAGGPSGGSGEEVMADAGDYGGGYSTGGGMGGATKGGGMPKNTAKYPPPKDIPSGNDDDVVARQLREAAMREPDPEVREKLWDEYRKYKGIKS
jgi:hypothetical protein